MSAAEVRSESGRDGPGQTALLVIDVQEFYFGGGAMPLVNPEAASANCKRLIEKFRKDARLIIHVAHNASAGADFHPDVKPQDGEKVFVKNEVSAFNGTDLLDYLRKNRVDKLVICGMQTHMCVEGAVRAAYDLGFECTVVGDACATRALTYGERTVSAEDVHSSTLSSLDRIYATVVDTQTFVESD
ncbi:MAG: cysteine hydrolase [Candidatus Latescibacterota bacterium]|nr:MAG: cysteine hydrolase [Candidatus Latescibacterota bacterium]